MPGHEAHRRVVADPRCADVEGHPRTSSRRSGHEAGLGDPSAHTRHGPRPRSGRGDGRRRVVRRVPRRVGIPGVGLDVTVRRCRGVAVHGRLCRAPASAWSLGPVEARPPPTSSSTRSRPVMTRTPCRPSSPSKVRRPMGRCRRRPTSRHTWSRPSRSSARRTRPGLRPGARTARTQCRSTCPGARPASSSALARTAASALYRYGTATGSILLGGVNLLGTGGTTRPADTSETNVRRCVG